MIYDITNHPFPVPYNPITSCMLPLLFYQLQDTTMDQASDLFKTNEDHELLASLKQSGLNGEPARVDEMSVKFEEHSDQLQEVSQRIKYCQDLSIDIS